MVSGFFRGFTATHKTIIIVAAIVMPGALYGAASYQAVAIVDPLTGANSFVDAGRRLYVYDPIAGYMNNTANFVKITGLATGDSAQHVIYTVPAGKALVVKSAVMSFYRGIAGNDNYFYFYERAGASQSFIAGFDDPNVAGVHNAVLGTGFYLHAGESIVDVSSDSASDTNLATEFSLEGYLVPATAVPAAASVEALQQEIQAGAPPRK